MSMARAKKAMLEELGIEVRRMSAQSVLISSAVAEQIGLSSSDLECLDFIVTAGTDSVTPGQLAASTGFTSGAITGLIDRLERGGFVRRAADPTDRRKIRIVAVAERVGELGVYYQRLAEKTETVWAQYSESELRTVLDFVRRCTALAAQEVQHIRTLPSLSAVKKKTTG